MTVLVTGGAGYIGGHVLRVLAAAGRDVLVVDDLSTGRAARLDGVPLLRLDLADPGCVPHLAGAMRTHGVTSVVHLAARKRVHESVQRPLWYLEQNVGGVAHVIAAMERAGVASIVFSSSAAVYGCPANDLVHEDDALAPVNPYGRTKLAGEWLVRSAARAWGLRAVSLRYFNVAGAGAPELGDDVVANLVTCALDRLARGQRPEVFGTGYPTPDGSCVRDFVHVVDLAEAHVVALDRLDQGGTRCRTPSTSGWARERPSSRCSSASARSPGWTPRPRCSVLGRATRRASSPPSTGPGTSWGGWRAATCPTSC